MKKLQQAKQQYEKIQIPKELHTIVETAINQAKREHKRSFSFKKLGLSFVAAASIFVASVNLSPAFAQSIAKGPFLQAIIEVITINDLHISEEGMDVNIKTPIIQGMENSSLENALNSKYTENNKALYEQFQKEWNEMKEAGGGHLGLSSGYEVLTDSEDILSISHYVVNTAGSSSTTMTYDTIDKKNELLITLPSLFKNDGYVAAISNYVLNEMKREMATDESKSYWVNEDVADNFKTIRHDQSFYITSEHKLVISFDKYEVGPGSMGVVTFEIPTDVIRPYLVSNQYIR